MRTLTKGESDYTSESSFLLVALQPNADNEFLIQDKKNDTTMSVGLLWTSDQVVTQTST